MAASDRTYYARVEDEDSARDFATIREAGAWVGSHMRERLDAVPLGTSVPEPKVFYIDGELTSVDYWRWTPQARRIFRCARDRAMHPWSS